MATTTVPYISQLLSTICCITAPDYSVRRGGVVPPDVRFRIVQKWEAPAATTAAPISTTTAVPETVLKCPQDIVCLCLDVSGSMDVSI